MPRRALLWVVVVLIGGCGPASQPRLDTAPPAPSPSASVTVSDEPLSARPTTVEPSQATPVPSSVSGTVFPFPSLQPSAQFAPGLEHLLPATLEGVPMFRFSAPGSLFDGRGSDFCILPPCGGEMFALATELGVGMDDLAVAIAVPVSSGPAWIIAVQDPSATPDQLIAARVRAMDARPTASVRIGSLIATYILLSAFGEAEYLYARDHVLFIVKAAATDIPSQLPPPTPDAVRLAFEALAALSEPRE